MYGYQPYGPNYGQYQSMGYMPSNQDVLQGKMVDSIDVVKAINVDMSGQVSWYPKSDKSEVYCKGLNPNTGSSYIMTYRLVDSSTPDVNNSQLASMIEGLTAELTEIKKLVTPQTTKKGGGAKAYERTTTAE